VQRIAALSDQIASGQQDIMKQQKTDTELLAEKIDRLTRSNEQLSLATPTQVGQQISELRKDLLTKADDAEAAYNKGYVLLNQYRFAEAIQFPIRRKPMFHCPTSIWLWGVRMTICKSSPKQRPSCEMD
jgi:hypothetical protein